MCDGSNNRDAGPKDGSGRLVLCCPAMPAGITAIVCIVRVRVLVWPLKYTTGELYSRITRKVYLVPLCLKNFMAYTALISTLYNEGEGRSSLLRRRGTNTDMPPCSDHASWACLVASVWCVEYYSCNCFAQRVYTCQIRALVADAEGVVSIQHGFPVIAAPPTARENAIGGLA